MTRRALAPAILTITLAFVLALADASPTCASPSRPKTSAIASIVGTVVENTSGTSIATDTVTLVGHMTIRIYPTRTTSETITVLYHWRGAGNARATDAKIPAGSYVHAVGDLVTDSDGHIFILAISIDLEC